MVGISKEDIQDIYEIRSRLEGLCAKWACSHITKEQLDELEENIYLSEFHAGKEGHAEQILELDNKFHEILYEASESPVLKHTLSDSPLCAAGAQDHAGRSETGGRVQ